MDATEYDLIVIGAGAVGENVADRAVQGGLSVVIVESELVGGECSYWACMPSKALLRAGAALARRPRRARRGARRSPGALDVAAVLRRRDEIVHDWDDAARSTGWTAPASTSCAGTAQITAERRGDRRRREARARAPRRRGLHRFGGAPARHPGTRRRRARGRAARPPRWRPSRMSRHPRRSSAAASWLRDGDRVRVVRAAVTLLARSALLGGLEPFAGRAVERGAAGSRASTCAPASTSPGCARSERRRRDARRRRRGRARTRCSSPPDASPRTGDLGLDSVGLEPGAWLDIDDTAARARHRLALRRRRRQPPRAAHPPGQVPGARRRRRHRGARARAPLSTTPAGACTSRPPTTAPCRRSSSPTPRSRRSA